jgi:hypothetical protein
VDVVSAVLAAADEGLAVDALRVRVEHWQRFMERAGEGLSASGQLGLYGELSFLRALVMAGCGPRKAIDGWRGPLSANHDFMYGKVAVEVKSTSSNSMRLGLSCSCSVTRASIAEIIRTAHCRRWWRRSSN